MIFKRIKNFLKSKKGSHAIETILVTPMWLAVILFCAYSSAITNARFTLANESEAFSNIIALSKTPEDAIRDIELYVDVNKLSNKFNKTNKNHYIKITKDINGGINATSTDWYSGDVVYVWATIDTAFSGVKFNDIVIGNYHFSFFSKYYTNRFTVILNNGKTR